MRSVLGIAVLTMVIALILPAQAVLAENYYMGIAVDYAVPDLGGEFEPENSAGINFRSGSIYADWLAIELNIDYLPDLEDNGTIAISGSRVGAGFDLEVLSFILDVKITPNVFDYALRPVLLLGFGWMISEAGSSQAAESYLKTRDIDDSDFCANYGVGLEYRISDTYSFDFKTSYVQGLRDVKDVVFLQHSLGLSFYF